MTTSTIATLRRVRERIPGLLIRATRELLFEDVDAVHEFDMAFELPRGRLTTHADVLAALDRAIARLEGER